MPIIVGVPRSGTTLLRFMLDSHPLLCIPPETGFLPRVAASAELGSFAKEDLFRIVTTFPPEAPGWEDFGLEADEYWTELQRVERFTAGEGLRALYRLYARKQNKPRYGDKTPGYCEHLPAIQSILPEAHFVHIIRDGRDAALSLRKMWFAPGRDMPTLAAYWKRLVRSAREAGLGSPSYMEVRYEDLVTNPQPALETICSFLGLTFHPEMLRYWERTPSRLIEHRTRRRLDGSVIVTHEQRLEQQRLTMSCPQPGRVSRWKTKMTAQEHSEFLAVAGGTLKELGYAVPNTATALQEVPDRGLDS
jgi:hypothetical protein